MRPILDVNRWPTYLLERVPANLRSAIALEAAEDDVSIADVIRAVLCERYKYHCPPASDHYTGGGTSPTILLRLQPRLHARLRIEAKDTHRSIRAIIISELERVFG